MAAPRPPRIYALNPDGKQHVLSPNFIAVCAVIRNGTNGAVIVTDAGGNAQGIAAGTTQTIFFAVPSDTVLMQTTAGAGGEGEIQLWDAYQATNQNPSQQQPPGLVTTGDPTTQQNTTALLGLLSGAITPQFTVTDGSHQVSPPRAFPRVLVQPWWIRTAGLLTLQIGGGGALETLVDQQYLPLLSQGVNPCLPIVYRDNFPAGYWFLVTFTGDGDFYAGY